MPSNKSVPDDDPELQDILMGGGLKEATLKDRKRMLGQFKEGNCWDQFGRASVEQRGLGEA